jgi:ribonuclease J
VEQYPDKIVDVFDVSKQQCNSVLVMSFYDLEELVDVKPKPGSCYILSASEPFNEEMEIDFERLINWLSHYGLPQYHVHVSGHIMPLQLKGVLKEINAATIFPIHTEHPDLFAKFMNDLKSRTVLVEKCKKYAVQA